MELMAEKMMMGFSIMAIADNCILENGKEGGDPMVSESYCWYCTEAYFNAETGEWFCPYIVCGVEL